MSLQAVLTGDIVNSTALLKAKEKKFHKDLQALFSDHKFEFYRGDSFQAHMKDPLPALRYALLSRTAAISLQVPREDISFDIRISIGIGKVESPVRDLKTAKGEAFVLSGRAFDVTPSEHRLAMTCNNSMANAGLSVIADYIDSIFLAMTRKQAEVIYQLLQGETQQLVAGKLRKTKSTIHQRVISGRWPEISRLLDQYENIINQLT